MVHKITLKKGQRQILELPVLEKLKFKEIEYPLPNFIKKDMKGIYFLFDKDKNLLYIGRTDNLRIRLNNHLSPVNFTEKLSSKIPNGIIKFLKFLEVDDKIKRDISEHIYLITYKTQFNKL